ncbi:LysR substrate-binding domain-containing protein [Shewanella gelidimarina]|uniref:LysR family transcriptional regulator n=1 Tax=Shewanella gelidimarina TaxID=56813 RepID=UPI00200BB6A0|nr:LysR family transcriptional regulator [Shewanella gelidimarina]MCL1059246.1 LysR substrate-binding domain-containing protein [Shewanella gelidimarina]
MMKRLQYFNAVVEAKSISEASRIFDVQPSSISRQLAVLENDLGVRLINRNSRSISLTEAGNRFYGYSKQIVSELDEAKRVVNDLQAIPKGMLNISTTVGFGEAIILPLIPAFKAQYPDINLRIEISERVVDLIEENIDVAIRSGSLADSSMIAKKLSTNDFVLCASPRYLKENGTPLVLEDLANHLCIKHGYAGWGSWFLKGEQLQKIEIGNAMEINTVNGQKQMILNHGGLALMPSWAVKKALLDGELTQVMHNHSFCPHGKDTSVYAVFLRRELISPKIRVFLDFLKDHLV